MKTAAVFFHLILLVSFTCSLSLATEVVVYSESGYSDTRFIMNIFTDIDEDGGGPLVSAGVKVTYPTEKLNHPAAVKNEAIWYFGSPKNRYTYIEPEVGENGEILILLGRLDVNSPAVGVGENRILLASLSFDRVAGSPIPIAPEFNLACARPSPFTNFATVTGVDLDGQIVFNASTRIDPLNEVFFRNSVRSLGVMSQTPDVIPVRPSELDIDNDNKIGPAEFLYYLQKATEKSGTHGP